MLQKDDQDKTKKTIKIKEVSGIQHEEKQAAQKTEEQEKIREPNNWFEPEGTLVIDVYQTDDTIVIQAPIAGIRSDQVDVSIENDVVTISGDRKNPRESEQKTYFHQECYWGPFSRQIILPEEVDVNRIEAILKDGIFTLRLPKMERQKLRKIKIRG